MHKEKLRYERAQAAFGVIPDICPLGKAISGGIPFSAVVGRKKVMDVFSEKAVIGAKTFNGYGLGVCASYTAIKIYERDGGGHTVEDIDTTLTAFENALRKTILDLK